MDDWPPWMKPSLAGYILNAESGKREKMHHIKRKTVLLVTAFISFFYFGFNAALAADNLSAREAIDHAGEYGTVCGTVASSRYAFKSKGSPTFLNLDEPYPDQVFTAVIWGHDRDRFEDAPEELYDGREICVEGLISIYRKKAQIIVSSPEQITLMEKAPA